jgi:hypothetical protein
MHETGRVQDVDNTDAKSLRKMADDPVTLLELWD